MLQVATIIANREVFRLTRGHGEEVAAGLREVGCKPLELTWLGAEEAFDITFEGPPPKDIQILQALGPAPVDAVVQPLAGRKKTLLVADMDSTIIAQECIDEIADVLGLVDKIAPITTAAMEGKLDFKTALCERVSLLKGISKTQLQEVFERRVTYTAGARTLIKTLANFGIKTALVSGGFTFFTDQVKAALGFDFALANELEFDGGVLSGGVSAPIVDGQSKKEFLMKLSNGSPENTLAIGDGANDIPMFGAAGFSLSYHGKALADRAADGRLKHTSLKSVLYVLGFRENTFRQ